MNGNSFGKKGLVVAVILLFISVSVISSTGIVVDKKFSMLTSFYDGDTLYVGGDGHGNYTRIQDAIDNASNGDTVFVFDDSSPYYENIVVDKSINLIGENKDTTIIDGGGNSDVVDIIVNGVTICNFKIQNSGVSFFIRGGIKIQSNQNSIEENIIKENDMGIYLPSGMNNTITSNIFLDNHNNGIWLSASSNNRICNNTISENGGGISLLRGENNLVSDNNITENQHNGIYITDSSRNCVLNNTITNNGAGIQVYWKSFNNLFSRNIIINNSDFNGIAIGESSNNTVSKNIIINSKYGIYIYRNSSFNTITENEIENNHFGIYFKANASYNIIDLNSIKNHEIGIIFKENCNNNSFIKNQIINNNFGVRLCFSSNKNTISENNFFNNIYDDIWIIDSSNNNHIYHNNFNDNTQNQNAYDLCNNLWNDIYPSGGNYWCKYQGGDANGDGLGDIPYNIPGGDNQDRYPLMEPYGQAELEITKVKGGIFSFTIKNVGDETVLNVSWSIHFRGGIVFPREQHSFNNYNLDPDEEITIIFWPSYIPEDKHFVFGIGRVIITMVANADNTPIVSKSIPGFLFLFFIMINPGG